MKILVLSDTHGLLKKPIEILKRTHGKIDAVIHLGDNTADAVELNSLYKDIPFYYVRGNCDSYEPGLHDEKEIILGGKKIILTHGHNLGVKYGYDRICYYTEEKEADVCLFGHTHVPEIIYAGHAIVMNPGSPSLPRTSALPAYGMLDISNDIIKPSIVQIDGNNFVIKRY